MKGVWFKLKIHIVQKGDTLWEISKQYGVDFDQVKQLNPQLSSPDMIMPGMKIKIPSTSKPVKKESVALKETQKQPAKQPYKDISPKPKPVMKEDDKVKPKEMKPQMPMQQMPMQQKPIQQMPMQPMTKMNMLEQEMNNYTTINFPQSPGYPLQKEKPQEMHHMPQPMIPICQHCFKPCCPPPPMHHGYSNAMHHSQPFAMEYKDCGCGGHQPMNMYNQMQPQYGNLMESSESSSISMDMPMKPMYSPQMNNYSPYNAPVSPQTMGMQQGFHSHVPPQSHPHFANVDYNNMPYPYPPGFAGNPMSNYREDEEDTRGE